MARKRGTGPGQGALLLCSARLVSISAPHGLDGALLPIAPVRAPCCPRGRRSKAKTVATPGPASTGNRSTRERPTSAARCPALGPGIAVPAKARRFCFGHAALAWRSRANFRQGSRSCAPRARLGAVQATGANGREEKRPALPRRRRDNSPLGEQLVLCLRYSNQKNCPSKLDRTP